MVHLGVDTGGNVGKRVTLVNKKANRRGRRPENYNLRGSNDEFDSWLDWNLLYR
jgi:hypothetical protein